MSARYPRVAVVLGVQRQWHVPLLLCRALSTISAAWWVCQTGFSIYSLVHQATWDASAERARSVYNEPLASRLFMRLAVAQICLSYLWVRTTPPSRLPFPQAFQLVVLDVRETTGADVTGQAGAAAYLAHMFASSLMARWLLHYSPFAVLVRLCSLSIVLSFGCMQIFRLSAATQPDLLKLSRSLLAWITISIALMLAYFCTQQDISVETDRDDRRRRQLLRLKCLYVISACSLFSLFVLACLVHVDTVAWEEVGVVESLSTMFSRCRQVTPRRKTEL